MWTTLIALGLCMLHPCAPTVTSGTHKWTVFPVFPVFPVPLLCQREFWGPEIELTTFVRVQCISIITVLLIITIFGQLLQTVALLDSSFVTSGDDPKLFIKLCFQGPELLEFPIA